MSSSLVITVPIPIESNNFPDPILVLSFLKDSHLPKFVSLSNVVKSNPLDNVIYLKLVISKL